MMTLDKHNNEHLNTYVSCQNCKVEMKFYSNLEVYKGNVAVSVYCPSCDFKGILVRNIGGE